MLLPLAPRSGHGASSATLPRSPPGPAAAGGLPCRGGERRAAACTAAFAAAAGHASEFAPHEFRPDQLGCTAPEPGRDGEVRMLLAVLGWTSVLCWPADQLRCPEELYSGTAEAGRLADERWAEPPPDMLPPAGPLTLPGPAMLRLRRPLRPWSRSDSMVTWTPYGRAYGTTPRRLMSTKSVEWAAAGPAVAAAACASRTSLAFSARSWGRWQGFP